MRGKKDNDLKKIGKEIAPGLYLLGDPRKAGNSSESEILESVLPRFQKQMLKAARHNSRK